uniref:Uncharacterized protein n=1 Tax=Phytophthora ramorum TaxID=164328 RepID=H3GFW8_PHYRM
MRRDGSRERLFFLLVLASALLLLSGLMLRHESAALSTRTFRDGFTVAEGVVRRTEIVAATDASDSNATDAPTEDSEAEVRTTTIKTEDGDEITIKRAATSKGNKITTISRDEKGKLTIEDTTEEEGEEEEERRTETQEGEKQDTLEDIPTGSPSAILPEDTDTTRREQEEAADVEGENEEAADVEGENEEAEDVEGADEEAVLVSGGKKVTLLHVNRSLTKVSLSDIEEGAEKATR